MLAPWSVSVDEVCGGAEDVVQNQGHCGQHRPPPELGLHAAEEHIQLQTTFSDLLN